MKSDVLYRLDKEGFLKFAEGCNQRVNQLIADYIGDRPFYIAKGEAMMRGAVGLIRFEDEGWISPKHAEIDGLEGTHCPWFTSSEVKNFLVKVEEKPEERTIEVMYSAVGQTEKENVWLNLDQVGEARSIATLMTSEEAHEACKLFLRNHKNGKAAIMKMVATAQNEQVPQTIFTEVN
jgi:hypothetical protein